MATGRDPVRVVLAEDSVLVREGIARLLSDAGLEVVAEAGDGDVLLEAVEELQPDVAIVDIRMPPTNTDEGLRAAQEIRARWPAVGVLLLSQYVEVGLASQLLARGANGVGYLLKDRVTDFNEFVAAVRRVAAGGSSLDPMVVSQLLALRQGDRQLDRLTPREREVLALMAEGLSNQAIADRFVVTVRAIEKSITAIFDKLDLAAATEVNRRVLAVLKFLRA